MVLRAKTKYLFDKFPLTDEQKKNTQLNLEEINEHKTILKSVPRRLVLELTNACNLNCIMCGRNAAKFVPTVFDIKWLYRFDTILHKTEEVSLFGWGEPTIHPKFADILQYLDKFPVRKYFCTNGMRLDALEEALFTYHVDIIAISLDGAKPETNNRIRRGGDFNKIVDSLKAIVAHKKAMHSERPYMNFVFCAMRSNYQELPELVKIAANIGLEEVKVVYFTAFDDTMASEALWNEKANVENIFERAETLGEELGVHLKLPHLQGEDAAGDKSHKDCFVGWRDLFLGSDGYVRPCMSTPDKFFKFDDYTGFDEVWNHEKMRKFRESVNDEVKMPIHCKNCYQSSHCNWNRQESFIQSGMEFAPIWESENKL